MFSNSCCIGVWAAHSAKRERVAVEVAVGVAGELVSTLLPPCISAHGWAWSTPTFQVLPAILGSAMSDVRVVAVPAPGRSRSRP
jgi:hypothetical protein